MNPTILFKNSPGGQVYFEGQLCYARHLLRVYFYIRFKKTLSKNAGPDYIL